MVRTSAQVPTGFGEPAATLDWGSHAIRTYHDDAELTETLVPYFRTGLERGERCIWVTRRGFSPAEARSALEAQLPALPDLEARGRMRFFAHEELFARNPGEIADLWRKEERLALAESCKGLRLSVDAASSLSDWEQHLSLEKEMHGGVDGRQILALCTYREDALVGPQTIDILRCHDLALWRRDGSLELCRRPSRHPGAMASAGATRSAEQLLDLLGRELREPLNVIGLAAERLSTLEGRARELGSRIRRGVSRIDAMAAALVDTAREHADAAIPLQRAPTNLAGVCRTLVEDARTSYPDRDIGLVVRGAEPGRWDVYRLWQAMKNLLDNALIHGDDPVRVTLFMEGGSQVVTMENRGRPIPAADQKTVFLPFQQTTDGARRGGLGLGLYSAAAIVRAHQGEIELTSDEQLGTRVTVRLPLGEERGAGE